MVICGWSVRTLNFIVGNFHVQNYRVPRRAERVFNGMAAVAVVPVVWSKAFVKVRRRRSFVFPFGSIASDVGDGVVRTMDSYHAMVNVPGYIFLA